MTTVYKVEGMTCGGCVRSLTRALEAALPGVKLEVQLEGGEVQVTGDHEPQVVKQTVEDSGFDLAG